MSLSTLLEAAKYLDYLDSNPQQGQQQQHDQSTHLHVQQQSQSHHNHRAQPASAKRSARRQRSGKKDVANTTVAMSLPTSTGAIQMQHGVPIPLASSSGMHGSHHHASLSSSFTTESPLSSFASTALLCSKASGVTSASSSAASSLSSSDSSSSCGEILMGDNDFNLSSSTSASMGGIERGNRQNQDVKQIFAHQQLNNNSNMEINNHHQQSSTNNQPAMIHKFSTGSYNDRGRSFARYIAATSTGPQLVTMTTTSSGSITSASAPIDGRIRTGHVIHAAAQNVSASGGANFDSQQVSIGSYHGHDGQTASSIVTSLGSDNHFSGSTGSCPPLIMARVQPMILNSISPSTHQSLMAFQPAHAAASSPTSSSSSYSRHRELHKTLEKNRRAHLRHCFELLKSELPSSECADKKTSHINIIKSAIRYVLALRQQECEIDTELQRLTKIKNEYTEKLSIMREHDEKSQINYQLSRVENRTQDTALIAPAITQTAMATTSMAKPTPSSPPTDTSSLNANSIKPEHFPQQQPVAEHQLSFLLSRSKID